MQRTGLLLIVLACVLATAPAREGASPAHVSPAKVGLVLIANTQEGFALAADGSSLNADGRVSQEQKLFPVGSHGAVALTGTVAIQDPIGGSVRSEVNVARIVSAWIAAHPDAELETANRELNAEIAKALNQFLSTRDPGAQRGIFKFGVIAAGFANGKPVLMTTRYFMPSVKGKPPRTEQASSLVQAGDLWVFGNSAAVGNGIKGGLSAKSAAQDYISFFDSVLKAAESEKGRKVDGKRAIVAPPNRFASITPNGFAWSQEAAK